MTRKGPARKRTSARKASKPYLPDPKDVIEVKDVRSPAGSFRILRTNIVDPYDEPLPPAPPRRKKR